MLPGRAVRQARIIKDGDTKVAGMSKWDLDLWGFAGVHRLYLGLLWDLGIDDVMMIDLARRDSCPSIFTYLPYRFLRKACLGPVLTLPQTSMEPHKGP